MAGERWSAVEPGTKLCASLQIEIGEKQAGHQLSGSLELQNGNNITIMSVWKKPQKDSLDKHLSKMSVVEFLGEKVLLLSSGASF